MSHNLKELVVNAFKVNVKLPCFALAGWQHPYVNIFKHVRVEDWKRSAKEGDVSAHMVTLLQIIKL